MNASDRRHAEAMYEQLARVGKALAAPRRLQLLELLGQGPATVDALALEAGLTIANASQHLQVLRAARLVDAERKGSHVEYRLGGEDVARAFVALRTLAEARLAEVEQAARAHAEARGTTERLDEKELVRRVRGGDVTVLDVRPAAEYRAGHLPKAVSIPLADLPARLGELPGRRPVVAYGRGPFCGLAHAAVDLLRRRGLDAHRLALGVLDWRARGHWLETPRRGQPG